MWTPNQVLESKSAKEARPPTGLCEQVGGGWDTSSDNSTDYSTFKDFILISILEGKFKMLKDFDDNMFLNELH